MTFVPPSELAVRVVPTPNGRGEVHVTLFRIRHQPSGLSEVRSAQTCDAGSGMSIGSLSRVGAVSKKLSSTGWALNHGRRMAASLSGANAPSAALRGDDAEA